MLFVIQSANENFHDKNIVTHNLFHKGLIIVQHRMKTVGIGISLRNDFESPLDSADGKARSRGRISLR